MKDLNSEKEKMSSISFEDYYHEVLNIAHGTIGFIDYIVDSKEFSNEEKLKLIKRIIIKEYFEQRKNTPKPTPEL